MGGDDVVVVDLAAASARHQQDGEGGRYDPRGGGLAAQ
jgi:hypothetical protein